MQRAITSFRGEAPRVTPRALPDNGAQDATNARLLTGDLTAWRQFSLTHALANAGPVQTISLMANTYWLSWDADVDVARGIIPGDTTYRTYLTSPDYYGHPVYTNLQLATTGGPEPYPVAVRPLGVPAPDSPPSAVPSIDPTSTSFSIDISDDCSSLDHWILSPGQYHNSSNVSEILLAAAKGNPAPSFQIGADNNVGTPAYAIKNFGTSGATIVEATWDVMYDDTGGNGGALLFNMFACDSLGTGARVILHGTTGQLAHIAVGVANGFVNGTIVAQTTCTANFDENTWYTLHGKMNLNADGTRTLIATASVGSTVIGTATATSTSFSNGDYFGPIQGKGDDYLQSYYDTLHVQASGSTGVVSIALATNYVYTFVNDQGAESAPSLPSETIVRPDGVAVTVTTSTVVPTGISGDYFITTKRIYRAATGNTGTVYRFVAEIPLSQADYVDILTDAELGEVLQSDIWALPPDDLEGILALPNGVMAGFSKNQLCLSAQDHPHAWPVEYRLTTDTNIIGIGNVDNTVVIGTESFIYVATGNDPAAYSMSKFEVPYACMSKRSVAYLTGIGVVFAGPHGLMAVTGVGQVRNLTEAVFTDLQWKALYPPSMRAVAHNDIYWLFWEAGSNRGCFAIDMKATGFGVVPMSFHASAMYVNPVGDTMYLVLDQANEPDDPTLPVPPSTPPYIDGTHVYEFEGSPTDLMTYRWRGKLNMLERPATMQIAQVRGEGYGNLLVRVYGDGTQVDEVAVTDGTEFTLATTDEYSTLEIELLGTSTVRIVQVAEDVAELS